MLMLHSVCEFAQLAIWIGLGLVFGSRVGVMVRVILRSEICKMCMHDIESAYIHTFLIHLMLWIGDFCAGVQSMYIKPQCYAGSTIVCWNFTVTETDDLPQVWNPEWQTRLTIHRSWLLNCHKSSCLGNGPVKMSITVIWVWR